MNEHELIEQRNYYVVKSNAMIQKSRYELSLQEQKIILRIIQLVEVDDEEFKEYTLRLKDMMDFCGINDSGKNYADFKKTILKLESKRWWITKENGTSVEDVTVGWIRKTKILRNEGIIKIQLDDDLKPYLLQLKKYFTKYNLYHTIAMRSKYSIRMYELLKSYENLHSVAFDLDKLKFQLMAEKYALWADFKRKVLDISLDEINKLTDLSVTYTTEKVGKKIQYITFKIEVKKDVTERLAAWTEIENRLSGKEIKETFSDAVNAAIDMDRKNE